MTAPDWRADLEKQRERKCPRCNSGVKTVNGEGVNYLCGTDSFNLLSRTFACDEIKRWRDSQGRLAKQLHQRETELREIKRRVSRALGWRFGDA